MLVKDKTFEGIEMYFDAYDENITFENCRFIACDFLGHISSYKFINCDFEQIDFFLTIYGTTFLNCTFDQFPFKQGKLIKSSFLNCKIKQMSFENITQGRYVSIKDSLVEGKITVPETKEKLHFHTWKIKDCTGYLEFTGTKNSRIENILSKPEIPITLRNLAAKDIVGDLSLENVIISEQEE